MPPRRYLASLAVIGGGAVLALAANTAVVRASWQELSQVLGLQGPPVPVSSSVLSQHHLEQLDSMPAQAQAEFLLERAMNHYDGAAREVERRLPSWQGKIEPNERFENLFRMAINSDDLRVRATAIEVDIVSRNLDKNAATVDLLEPAARGGAQGPRVNALWDLALLGNRGTEPGRVAQIILASVHDGNVNIRYWAVEALAYLGSDETIEPLLDIFHDDPSPMIRERAACSLAQSGMLGRDQRMSAVPRLIDDAGDAALDEQTRGWALQALRDITGQNFGRDLTAWRTWYASQR
jgi:HEAT repeat protein